MSSEESKQEESVVGGGSWVWRVLGILLATATCISIVKNGFSIELYGLPAKVFEQYAWLRDTLFEPVAWMLRYFGLIIPWWLKDLIMAYSLIAGAHWRTDTQILALAMKLGIISVMPSSVQRCVRATLWPVYTSYRLWRGDDPLRLRHETLELARKVARSSDETFLRTYVDWTQRSRYYHEYAVENLVVALVFSAGFFLWNHLGNVFGPGG
jgi:hypothetical protein